MANVIALMLILISTACLCESTKSNKLNILIVGKTGIGKSTLINALLGKEVAPINNEHNPRLQIENKAKTFGYYHEEYEKADAAVEVCEVKNISSVKELKKSCSNPDVIILCVSIKDYQWSYYVEIIKIVTLALGNDIWKNAVHTITFANRINDENEIETKKRLAQKEFQESLRDLDIDDLIITSIPTVLTGGIDELYLPDIDNWFTEFFLAVFNNTNPSNRLTLIKINEHRIIKSKSQDSKPDKRYPLIDISTEIYRAAFCDILNKTYAILFGVAAVAIGAVMLVGGPVGWLVGGAIGIAGGIAIYVFQNIYNKYCG